MVRKGSPVRVRERACTDRLRLQGFPVVLSAVRLHGVMAWKVFGKLLGRPRRATLQADSGGPPVPVGRGTLPSMHSFRHTVASRALLAGETVDEVAFPLGDGTVTQTVYVREVAKRQDGPLPASVP